LRDLERVIFSEAGREGIRGLISPSSPSGYPPIREVIVQLSDKEKEERDQEEYKKQG
jgi:hypothetical protein